MMIIMIATISFIKKSDMRAMVHVDDMDAMIYCTCPPFLVWCKQRQKLKMFLLIKVILKLHESLLRKSFGNIQKCFDIYNNLWGGPDGWVFFNTVFGSVGYWKKIGLGQVRYECQNKRSGIFVYLIKSRVFPGILGISRYLAMHWEIYTRPLRARPEGNLEGRGGGVYFNT